MNNMEKAFQEWWRDAEVRGRIFTVGFQEYAAIVWTEAWEAALNERDFLRAKLVDKAIEAFRGGREEPARLYRDLANELFPEIS